MADNVLAGATLYDGLSARGQAVAVAVTADALVVAGDGVALSLLHADTTRLPRLVLHRRDRPDWRLTFAVAPPGLPRLPPLHRPGGTAVAGYALAGAVAVTLIAAGWMFGGGWLDALAPLVPQRTLATVGHGLAAQVGGEVCTAPAGRAALARLVARLTPPGFPPVAVRVTDQPLINALALPGNEIIVFRGLVDKAGGPDEVAGVVAHELAHVAHRDPTRALLRQMGVSLLVRSIGGETGGVVDLALVLASSRTAERAADAGALTLLARAHVSAAGLLAFFRRMNAETAPTSLAALGAIARFAASHPGDAERIAMVAAAPAGTTTPALSPEDWQALRAICYSHGDDGAANPRP